MVGWLLFKKNGIIPLSTKVKLSKAFHMKSTLNIHVNHILKIKICATTTYTLYTKFLTG